MKNIIENSKTKFLLVLLLALLLRLAGIISRPIWYDESFSILFAEKGLSAMIYGTLSPTGAGAADIHPLGYYTLLWMWMKIFGTSVFAARIFSILISLASLALVYKIAHELFNEITALTAALLMAILPFQIHFAQEIRMYAPLSFFLLAATYSFLRGRRGNWKWWIGFAIFSALAQYTHNLAAFYLIPLALTPIFQRDWKTLRSLTLAGFAALGIYAPWLIQLPAQVSKVQSSYWVERPGVEKVFTLMLFYLPHLPLPNAMLLPGLLIGMLVITLAFFQTALAGKNKLIGTNGAIWAAYLAFFPPVLLWLVSQTVPVYIERALLPSHAMFCIWLAWAFTQTKMPRPIQGFAALLILAGAWIGIQQHLTYQGFPYAPFAKLDSSLQSRMKTGDAIIHSSKLSYLPAFYFDRDLPQGFIADPPGSSVDTLAPATQEILRVSQFSDVEQAAGGATRIWFIIYQNSIDEYPNSLHPHLEYLNEHFKFQSVENWGELRLYLYTKK